MIDKPFVLYSDQSGKPDIIYIGSDKAAAFDALMVFKSIEYFDSNNLHMEYALSLNA